MRFITTSMNEYEGTTFLFNIAKEIKKSFESPVIFFTSRDYADEIYRSLIEIRNALQDGASAERIAEIVNKFHLEWLQAVRDIEEFKKRIKDTPREVIQNAVDYTITCVANRYENFKRFLIHLKELIAVEDKLIMHADLEIMKDMKESVIAVLNEKKTCLLQNADQTEYLVKLNFEIEELFNWLDRLNDSLAIQFCKVIHLQGSQLPNDLTRTLKQIIDEVTASSEQSALEVSENIEGKGKFLCSMIRMTASHELEVCKVTAKIKALEERIEKKKRSKEKESSAVLALQHKVIYLEERLESLENLKLSLNALKFVKSKTVNDDVILDNTELHIFDHNLAHEERCQLVERLITHWQNALNGDDTGKSIISILSAADMQEDFTDDIGTFTVDKYGRKIYTRESSDVLYQLNENNELVEVNDDNKHVYFYDDCGRYYLSESRSRIYKAHENASEYELHPTGQLMKLKETVDGIEYRYDNNGRFYINELGNRIYSNPETGEKYEQDGFGNLVRIRSEESVFKLCPPEPMVVNESKYLQHAVGYALKKCLANVLLHQPADPIGFLADHLVKYRENMEARQKRLNEEKAMAAERVFNEPDSVPVHSYVTEEEAISRSSVDENFKNYQTALTEY